MDLSAWTAELDSPAFVYDEQRLRSNFQATADLCRESGCHFLFSIKALSLQWVIKLAAEYVDGYSVSSLFEARLVKDIVGSQAHIHLTTPGMREHEYAELDRLCSHISFNSLSQMKRLSGTSVNASLGIRLNPKVPAQLDQRYDPCRLHSKLGIDLSYLQANQLPDNIEGLHFHTMFGSNEYDHLLLTVEKITKVLGQKSSTIQWLNLGGGYFFSQIEDRQGFIQMVKNLQKILGVTVFIEPGNAIVGEAGFLVSKVIDRFSSDQKTVVIVDTSVNHHPEVFEYQVKPPLCHPQAGSKPVIIAGSTCLAGDVFGEYFLEKMPNINDLIAFGNTGAYSLVKASRFNGYNLPTIYKFNRQQLMHLKTYEYQDFRQHWTSQE